MADPLAAQLKRLAACPSPLLARQLVVGIFRDAARSTVLTEDGLGDAVAACLASHSRVGGARVSGPGLYRCVLGVVIGEAAPSTGRAEAVGRMQRAMHAGEGTALASP